MGFSPPEREPGRRAASASDVPAPPYYCTSAPHAILSTDGPRVRTNLRGIARELSSGEQVFEISARELNSSGGWPASPRLCLRAWTAHGAKMF